MGKLPQHTSAIRRVWESPTLMTWGSYSTVALRTVLVLPLVLRQFTPSEIALWYLLATISGLQTLADAGFTPTFIRAISYAMGGTSIAELSTIHAKKPGSPNWEAVRAIYGTMSRVYLYLSLFFLAVAGLVGTFVLRRTVEQTADSTNWFAWLVTLGVAAAALRAPYSAFLQGTNNIALLRRWEMLFGVCGLVSSLLLLLLHQTLLVLVISNQAWQLLAIGREAWLTRTIARSKIQLRGAPSSKEVFRVAWPNAWRSAIGVLMSYGLVAASGMVYAQYGRAEEVAAYLFSLRIYQIIREFSMAPFYSGLPEYSRLYAERRNHDLVQRAQTGMLRSHCTYVAGFIGVGMAGPIALRGIHANIQFPSLLLWGLLGVAFLFERYGAMHIQLYSTTNRIIWHVANGVTGSVCIVVTLVLITRVGLYAFPIGLIAGYGGFYSWYTAVHSYRMFDLKFPRFELRAAVFPFIAAVVFLGVVVFAM